MKSNKLIYGVGVNDLNVSLRSTPQIYKRYQHWNSMLRRCYRHKKDQLSYNGYTVCEEWHKFSNFNKWMQEHERPNCQLDKDILVKGNNVYSPSTCCLVPLQINSLFIKQKSRRGCLPIGVYKTNNGNFASCFRNKTSRVHIGVYDTPELAFYAYKQAKEQYIKEIATQHYKENKIAKNVYDALLAYEVDIKD